MPEKRVKDSERTEAIHSIQPVVLIFVAAFGALLLLAPFLPVLISNFVYSLSGEKPKIYWYLSRSAGFITLSILWVSMALGLGLTNKLARLWPGAPTAFSVHQYVSLLGLGFTTYHALVMMGDHYVDFSFPRLVTPFSIAYERFWVGLGQVGFYIWVIVVASFYVRKHIGQKTWRVIHYLNFVTYVFGMLHGLFSGADAKFGWAQMYYWLSGTSILVLLGYRIYKSTAAKRQGATPKAVPERTKRPQPAPSPVPVPVPIAAQRAPSATPVMQAAPRSSPANVAAEPVISAHPAGAQAKAPAIRSVPSTPPVVRATPPSKPVRAVPEPIMSASSVEVQANVPATQSVLSAPPVPASVPINVTVELVLPAGLVGAQANIRSSQAVPEKPRANVLPAQAMPERREPAPAANEASSITRPASAVEEPITDRVRPASMPVLRVTRNPRGVSRRPTQASSSQHPEPALPVQGNAPSMRTPQPPWRKVYIGGAQSKPRQESTQADTAPFYLWFQEDQLPRPDPYQN